jgi:hypothetical protein
MVEHTDAAERADGLAEDEADFQAMIDYVRESGGRPTVDIFDVPFEAFAGSETHVNTNGERTWLSARLRFGRFTVTLFSTNLPQITTSALAEWPEQVA